MMPTAWMPAVLLCRPRIIDEVEIPRRASYGACEEYNKHSPDSARKNNGRKRGNDPQSLGGIPGSPQKKQRALILEK